VPTKFGRSQGQSSGTPCKVGCGRLEASSGAGWGDDGMKPGKQTTLGGRAVLNGRGVHSNAPVQIVLHPCDPNAGISFIRTDIDEEHPACIDARWSEVATTRLCTVIGKPEKASVSTVEHVMAALAGLGVDNAVIEIDGPEMPIMDGSAQDFVTAIDRAGIVELGAYRRYLKILKPVRVDDAGAFSELRPASSGFRLEVEIEFSSAVIGHQRKVVDLAPSTFRRELARARTFGFLRDVERLWKAGFALGSSLENSVALDDERVLNPEGLRFPDEFVRHKMLDAVGDLALAGAPIIGAYRSYCSGHRLNVAVLEALFADRSAYAFVEAPRRREGGRAALAFGAAPAYALEPH
jgi:UDP-3-O-[3-hydroxymyristoyl] N-acetylglucosamine deacetylase